MTPYCRLLKLPASNGPFSAAAYGKNLFQPPISKRFVFALRRRAGVNKYSKLLRAFLSLRFQFCYFERYWVTRIINQKR